jgi:hypothetical protein
MEIQYFDLVGGEKIYEIYNELTVPREGEALIIDNTVYEVINVYYHYREITLGESIRHERSHVAVILNKLGKDVN